MNHDPRTEARFEAEAEEIERQEQFDDLMTALKCLLKAGEKKAAIMLINKVFTEA